MRISIAAFAASSALTTRCLLNNANRLSQPEALPQIEVNGIALDRQDALFTLAKDEELSVRISLLDRELGPLDDVRLFTGAVFQPQVADPLAVTALGRDRFLVRARCGGAGWVQACVNGRRVCGGFGVLVKDEANEVLGVSTGNGVYRSGDVVRYSAPLSTQWIRGAWLISCDGETGWLLAGSEATVEASGDSTLYTIDPNDRSVLVVRGDHAGTMEARFSAHGQTATLRIELFAR